MEKDVDGTRGPNNPRQLNPRIPNRQPPAFLQPARHHPAGTESSRHMGCLVSPGRKILGQVNAVEHSCPVAAKGIQYERRACPRPDPGLNDDVGPFKANQAIEDRPGPKAHPAADVRSGVPGLPDPGGKMRPEPAVKLQFGNVKGQPERTHTDRPEGAEVHQQSNRTRRQPEALQKPQYFSPDPSLGSPIPTLFGTFNHAKHQAGRAFNEARRFAIRPGNKSLVALLRAPSRCTCRGR